MKITSAFCSLLACLLLATSVAPAFAALKITEVYPGVSGPDGTSDWIEITNFGAAPISLDGLFYDDGGSPTIMADQALADITVGAGESVVALVDFEDDGNTPAGAVADFQAVWGTGITVFAVTGGGGLGGGGDTANILDGAGSIIDSFTYSGALTNTVSTLFDTSGMGVAKQSVFGVGGTFVSNPFANDSLFTGITEIALTGSPGVNVPEPAAASLLCLMLAAAGVSRRRR
ncbi:MAG: lamin tail domain-containing protein [Planctomycetota bacterium]